MSGKNRMSAKPRYLSGFSGLLRRIADRIDYQGAPKCTGMSFTFEQGEGIRLREDGKGCPVWYLGEDDYQRAHEEADSNRIMPERLRSWKHAARYASGGVVKAPGPHDDRIPAVLSSGCRTYLRSGETHVEAMARLVEGEDL